MAPIITAIMPTTIARLPFLPLSIECLRRQKLGDRLELIVVSEDERARWRAISEAESARIEVRAFSCAKGTPIGTKRDIACAEASGEWITFWDDDDWSHPERLAKTIALFSKDVEMVGSSTMLIHELIDPRRRTFCYHYEPLNETFPRRWFVGGLLTFRRSLWKQSPGFAPTAEDNWPTGEEGRWQKAIGDVPAAELREPALYVAMIHGKNVANRQAPNGDPTWRPWETDLRALMGADLDCWERAAAG